MGQISCSKFVSKNSGLLALIQPILAEVADLSHKHNKSGSYKEILLESAAAFVKSVPVAMAFLGLDFKVISYSYKWGKFIKQLQINPKKRNYLKGELFFKLLQNCPKQIKAALQNARHGKSSDFDLVEYKTKTQIKYIRWESFPLLDEDKKPIGIVTFIEDVTSVYKLHILNKNLYNCNQMLESFALTLSHDVVQPIRQVSNLIAMLKEHLSEEFKSKDAIKQIFKAIDKSFTHIRDFIEGITLYSKRGNLTANSEEIKVLELINRIQESCLISNDFKLNILLEEDIIIYANYACMVQLFQNLLINAVRHSLPENVVITLSGKKLNSQFFQFSLHNNGCCIFSSPNELFEPFKSTFVDGAGLGLMICKKIISAYKGHINIKSSVKGGTSVVFTLPLMPVNNGASYYDKEERLVLSNK